MAINIGIIPSLIAPLVSICQDRGLTPEVSYMQGEKQFEFLSIPRICSRAVGSLLILPCRTVLKARH